MLGCASQMALGPGGARQPSPNWAFAEWSPGSLQLLEQDPEQSLWLLLVWHLFSARWGGRFVSATTTSICIFSLATAKPGAPGACSYGK